MILGSLITSLNSCLLVLLMLATVGMVYHYNYTYLNYDLISLYFSCIKCFTIFKMIHALTRLACIPSYLLCCQVMLHSRTVQEVLSAHLIVKICLNKKNFIRQPSAIVLAVTVWILLTPVIDIFLEVIEMLPLGSSGFLPLGLLNEDDGWFFFLFW